VGLTPVAESNRPGSGPREDNGVYTRQPLTPDYSNEHTPAAGRATGEQRGWGGMIQATPLGVLP